MIHPTSPDGDNAVAAYGLIIYASGHRPLRYLEDRSGN